jgi:hypothetical protein
MRSYPDQDLVPQTSPSMSLKIETSSRMRRRLYVFSFLDFFIFNGAKIQFTHTSQNSKKI